MKSLFTPLIALFLVACGGSVYDDAGYLICKTKEECGTTRPENLIPPAGEKKFTNILKNCKLHYPESQTKVPYGEFEGFATEYFYLEGGAMTFQLDKTFDGKYRSELRQGPETNEWDASEKKAHTLKGSVKCYGSEKLTKYTFVQIHGNEDFSLPLLRMVWEKRHDGKTNHIWAVIMTSRSFDNKTYDWIDLGERKSEFVDLEVTVQKNHMHILFDNKTIDRNVSYWYDIKNYYKAGLYLNDKESRGITKVQFRELEYIVE